MTLKTRALIAGLLLATAPISGYAATLTSASFTPTGIYGFNSGPSVFTSGPVVRAIGASQSVTFNSTSPSSVFDYASGYNLATNGSWNSARNGYAGLNSSSGFMSFTLSEATNAIGGFVNYATGGSFGDMTMRIYGAGDVLLESFNITQSAAISTPGGSNAGAFRGFQRATADILRLEVGGAFVVIDDLAVGSFDVAPVPLPATAVLMIAALAGLGTMGRRKA